MEFSDRPSHQAHTSGGSEYYTSIKTRPYTTHPFNNHHSSIRGLLYLFIQLRPGLLTFFKVYLDNWALGRERKQLNHSCPRKAMCVLIDTEHWQPLYLSNTFPGRPLMLTLTKEHGHSEGGGHAFHWTISPALPSAGKGKTSMWSFAILWA